MSVKAVTKSCDGQRLSALASEIRAEVTAAETSFRSAVTHAIRAGELLIEAKTAVPHGEWGTWLAANFTDSERTARRYMQLAANRTRVADLPSIREAVAMLVQPSQPDLETGERVTFAEARDRLQIVSDWWAETTVLLEARIAIPRPVTWIEATVISELLRRGCRAISGCCSDAEDLGIDVKGYFA